ncbi:hypothetical protein BASA50_006427 [Batrachochytrium salamandrivorans]|uniref:Extracellular metalloproteinase n=1 Tax=Batrachochytrium salamandrivorans TaxID=1357716 RepID=A0ABQ8FA55_9FUNG|nr:hypothetical protein BASA50_006427 [Batrachochytrium salamandrivorans]
MFGPALTLVLALISSAVIAVPMVDNAHRHAVASLNPSSTKFPFYFPNSVYESILYSDLVSLSFSERDDVKIATDFICNKLNLDADDFKVFDFFTDAAGVTHVYGAHMINNVRIANHHAAAHAKNGQVTSFSSSFGTTQHFSKRDLIISAPEATVDFEQVSVTISAKLEIPVYSDFEYVLEYVEQPDGRIVYAYKFQLRNNPVTKWVEVWCDAGTGEVVQAVNFAHKASYKAIPLSRRNATPGFSMIANPEFEGSSPNGWTAGKVTVGNNVITLTPSGESTPSTKDGVFDTKFNSKKEPDTDENIAAAAVNLFYVTNVIHDIAYQYGFTEKAGNFQTDNFGKGGKGGDPVVINVINTSEVDNADFLASPDGQPGVMNMFLFETATPSRTPAFDNSVIIHEYAHGISNRLTGGPSTDSCLTKAEAAGMDEGWSDIISMIVLAKKSDTATTKMTIGAYAENSAGGFRSRPYTTDMKVNSWTYGDLKSLDEVHDVGEVWASMLWEVYWNLVAKHGFATNLYDADQSAGNVIAMKIILGGMTIQSCNPTFRAARDAIVAADLSYYDGANKCEILKGFAKRGLGSDATSGRKNDFSVPSECQE